MRIITKIVLIIVLITLVYSVAKLISAKTTKHHQVTASTISQNQSMQNNQNQPNTKAPTAQQTQVATKTPQVLPTPDTPNAQGLYQADEILIDGQGKAGSNYIDITSDTPITPQPQNNAITQNNNYNGGGAYAEASVSINNNNNTSTSSQQYAPGVPAFEVLDGN